MTNSPAHDASEALRRSEAELRALLAAMPDIVIVFDHEGRYRKIVSSNPRLLYAPIASRIGTRVADTPPHPLGDFFMEHIEKSLATGQRITASYQLPLEGRNVWFEAAIAPVDAQTVIWVARDITDWQLAEIALRESEERLAQALEAANAAVYDRDIAGERLYLTPEWAERLGLDVKAPAADQATWRGIIHPDDWPRVNGDFALHLKGGSEAFESEYRVRTRDGRWLWILDRGRVIARDAEGQATRMIGTHVNITDRRRLVEQLRQAQKMEAVGRLAGGIAHDFNNLLTVILGYARPAAAPSSGMPSDPRDPSVEEIREAAERAAALTRQLLAFSRRQVARARACSTSTTLVEEPGRMLRRLIGEDIELVIDAQPSPGSACKADPGQIEQVLVNLVVNARDAMPRGRRLTIETGNVSSDDASQPRIPASRRARYVRAGGARHRAGHGRRDRERRSSSRSSPPRSAGAGHRPRACRPCTASSSRAAATSTSTASPAAAPPSASTCRRTDDAGRAASDARRPVGADGRRRRSWWWRTRTLLRRLIRRDAGGRGLPGARGGRRRGGDGPGGPGEAARSTCCSPTW